ncbi:hypothetical protein PAENIP36_45720 [Paenibacillus sp. P36]
MALGESKFNTIKDQSRTVVFLRLALVVNKPLSWDFDIVLIGKNFKKILAII